MDEDVAGGAIVIYTQYITTSKLKYMYTKTCVHLLQDINLFPSTNLANVLFEQHRMGKHLQRC
jgi:hypothetical protein